MDDLVAWLRAQLDKDQEITEKVRADAVAIRRAGNLARDPSAADRYDAQVRWATADNEAKRRILDEIVGQVSQMEDQIDNEWGSSKYPTTGPFTSDVLVKLLALPYADRPGYQEEWKP